jgi:hypothetical protein
MNGLPVECSILTVLRSVKGMGTVSFVTAREEVVNGAGEGWVVWVFGMARGAVEVAVEMGEKR